MTKNNLPVWRVDNYYAFFVSIAVSVFAFAGLYFGLSNKIDLLTQKVDYLVQQVGEYNERNKDVQTRIGISESNIQVIFTKLGMLK